MSELEKRIYELGQQVKNRTMTWKEASNQLFREFGEKVSADALRKRYDRVEGIVERHQLSVKSEELGDMPEQVLPEKIEYYKDKTVVEKVIELTEEEKQDQYAVLDKLGWNSENWEVGKFGLSNWQQHTRSEGTKNLYSVKMEIKPRNVLTPEQQIDAIKEVLEEMQFDKYEFEPTPMIDGLNEDVFTSLPITDFHWNAYIDELSAGVKWNRRISKGLYEDLIEQTIVDQQSVNAHKLVFPIGNDFLNIDGSTYATTRGTQQVSDGSFKEGYKGAMEMHIKAINTFKEHYNEIELMMVESNHSQDSDFTMYLALKQLYENEPKVVARDNYEPTQVVRWGKTMVVYNHGDTRLAKNCGTLAHMFSKDYGQTDHRYLVLGHIHNGKEHWEDSGFNVHSLPTLFPSNEWAKKNGFVSSQRKQVIQHYHKEFGLIRSDSYTAERLKKNARIRRRELREQKKLIKTKKD